MLALFMMVRQEYEAQRNADEERARKEASIREALLLVRRRVCSMSRYPA